VSAIVSMAGDVLREAKSRRWFLGLWVGITLVLAILGLGLRMEVVDGALAATRLFGKTIDGDIRSAEVALRPVFEAAAYLFFYGGLVFGIVACSDFAPGLLSPGRIEHLLSLPLRRWELLAGTFAGVMCLAVAGSLYGATGLVILLGVKTGVWTARPLVASIFAALGFAPIYSLMLGTALLVRSAALSAASGTALMALGIVASYRTSLAPMIEPGFRRASFEAALAPIPRVSQLANLSAGFAASTPIGLRPIALLLLGFAAFSLALLALEAWYFDRKDF
jgi:Cu-processing system permease protein